jgi:hypothetical protein
MKREYVAFDIEIAKIFPEDEKDWKKHRPLGITCAATLTADAAVKLWYGRTKTGEPAARMGQDEIQRLVRYLQEMDDNGYTILTWNGLSFDFDILSEESGMMDECSQLALGHVDMMFHFFCLQGYALGLDKAAKGMGLKGKPEGMSGALAPRLWDEGKRDEVLKYVAQDVRTILDLGRAVEKTGDIRWTSNRGRPMRVKIASWLPVREALDLPHPDTSWMTEPWPRSKFTSWLRS